MASIFISYRSPDRDFVLRLAQSLQQNGHDIWLDQWRITGRDPYWDEIQHGIESVRFFIFVISPDSVSKESNNGARKELYHAAGLANGPTIVPIMARETPLSDIPIVISPGMYQIHNFVHLPYQNALLNVLAVLSGEATAVNRALQIPTSAAKQPPPVAPAPPALKTRSRLPLFGLLAAIVLIALIAGYGILRPGATSTPTQLAILPSATTQVLIAFPVTATAFPINAVLPSRIPPTIPPTPNPTLNSVSIPATAVPTLNTIPTIAPPSHTPPTQAPPTAMPTTIPPPTVTPIPPTFSPLPHFTSTSAMTPTASQIKAKGTLSLNQNLNVQRQLNPAILNALLTPGAGTPTASPTSAVSSFSGPKLVFFQKGSNTLVTGYLDNAMFYQLPNGGDSTAADWTAAAGTTNGLIVFYNETSSKVEVGHIAEDGTYKVLKTFGFKLTYTHLIGLANQMLMFYKADTGVCTIERIGTDGSMTSGYDGPCPVGESIVASAQDGQMIVLYNQKTQQITTMSVNSDGSAILQQWFGHPDPAENWSIIADAGSDRVLLYAANGTWALYQIAAKGALDLVNSNSDFSTDWTHILNTNGQLLFYNTAYGSSYYGSFGSDARLSAGSAQVLNEGWTLIASTR